MRSMSRRNGGEKTRGYTAEKNLDTIFAVGGNGAAQDHTGVLTALEGSIPERPRAGRRSSRHRRHLDRGWTQRRRNRRALSRTSFIEVGSGISDRTRKLIEEFLAIEADPDKASTQMRALARSAGIDLSAVLDRFDARLGFMAARGLDIGTFTFAARFVRNLDYYTGFVFEAHEQSAREKPVIGGGRYDGLMQSSARKRKSRPSAPRSGSSAFDTGQTEQAQ